MARLSRLMDQLVAAFQCLPGVGPRSAQRMALYLLERDRARGNHLARSLVSALEQIHPCERCRVHTEEPLCAICRDPSRDASVLCVVETAADLLAVEQSGHYRGYYFVLLGRLSPLDGIGPDELAFSFLFQRVQEEPITEVILATNATMEGQATAHYLAASLAELSAQRALPFAITRIAHGMPMGGELELSDGYTLTQAFSGRVRCE